MKVPAQATTLVRFEISPRSIAWILATIVGVWLFLQLRSIVLLLVVALVFAGTFNPLVEWMERRGVKRIYALTLLFVALLLATSLLIFLTVPPFFEQLAQIVRDAPHHREQLIALLQQRDFTAPLARALEHAGLEQPFSRIESSLVGYTPRALTALGWAVTTLFLSFYLLADGKRMQGALYAIVPRDYHMRLARILQNLEAIVGGYMRGQLITSVAVGVFTYLLLVICGVPNALSLALFAAVVDVIPFIGALLATAPAVLVALSQGLPTGLVVLVALFIYQEIENRILIPKVYARSLRLAPATVVLALLAGGLLLGVIGALLALPIAAGLQMMLAELRVELPGDDSDDRLALARDAKTEATYERMSAGASAPEAGRIAKNLAHDIREADAVDVAKEPVGVAS
jgi:predicted PurR-regulated permease PerM